MSNVPVLVLADKAGEPFAWLLLLGVTVAWISEWFWRLSLRHFTSASS